MPKAPSVLPQLTTVLRGLAPGHPATIRAEDRLIDQLGFDSVSLAQAIVEMEDCFGVELPQNRLHELRSATVAEVAGLIESSRGQA
jgi:acyl carrier protein